MLRGFVGIVSPTDPGVCVAQRSRMLASLQHGPGLHCGSAAFDSLRLYVGWTHQRSQSEAAAPVWNEARDVCLIWDGEEYSAPDIDARRTGLGVEDRTALRLLYRYLEDPKGFFPSLNGIFRGLLIDLRTERMVLFNDRYGLRRVYVHRRGKSIYFASEAKALIAALPELGKLDPDGLADQFACGAVLGQRTLFRGIDLLPPAARWTVGPDGGCREAVYFEPGAWEEQEALAAEEFQQAFDDTFQRILPRYTTGDGKVAMSLTGGLDGRMIMAVLQARPGSLPCYTFSGIYRESADVRIARQVARVCRQPHTTVRVDADFRAEFPQLAERTVHASDGTMDVSGAVEMYVNRMAQCIAPVRLTGNYGSEILRRNVAFRPVSLADWPLTPDFMQLTVESHRRYFQERQVHPLSFIAFRQVPWFHHARYSIESSQLNVRSPYLNNDLVRLMYRVPQDLAESPIPAMRMVAAASPALARIPTDRGLLYVPGPILSPLRSALQRFTAKAEYAHDYGMPQWLAGIDCHMRSLQPERLWLGRHKFYHFRVWYRDWFPAFLREVLLDPRSLSRDYLDRDGLVRLVNRHIAGQTNATTQLHGLLTAELAHRLFVERP